VTGQAFSFDCYLEESPMIDTDVYYQKVVLMGMLPIAIVLISALVWGIVCLIKRTTYYLK
jgi:hypothetical protein